MTKHAANRKGLPNKRRIREFATQFLYHSEAFHDKPKRIG